MKSKSEEIEQQMNDERDNFEEVATPSQDDELLNQNALVDEDDDLKIEAADRVHTTTGPLSKQDIEKALLAHTELDDELPPHFDAFDPPIDELGPQIGEDDNDLPSPTSPRQIIAVASGKGGVGKSTIAASIGIYLAQLGRHVVLIDSNWGSPNLHSFVGSQTASPSIQGFLSKKIKHLTEAIIETPFDKLGLISGHGDSMGTANPRPAQKNRFLAQLDSVAADYVIIDSAPGTGYNALDTLLASTQHVIVVTPEPTSIESAFRLIKSAFIRKIRNVDELESLLEATAEHAYCGIPTPYQLLAVVRKEESRQAILGAMESFRPLLVVNKSRVRQDLELGPALTVLARRHLGLPVEYIGYLEHDDIVLASMRKQRPLLVQYPDARVSKDLERLSRRILARDTLDRTASEVLPVPLSKQNHFEILGIHPGANEAEVRSAYRRVMRIYQPDSPALFGVVPPSEIEPTLERIEQAYAVLVHPEKSQNYIREIFPDWQGHEDKRLKPVQDHPVVTTILSQPGIEPIPAPPMPQIDEHTLFTGALLQEIREAHQMEIEDVADATKISTTHLKAIEEENSSLMPATVYLKGFIKAIAKHLKLDPKQVVNTYLLRIKRLE